VEIIITIAIICIYLYAAWEISSIFHCYLLQIYGQTLIIFLYEVQPTNQKTETETAREQTYRNDGLGRFETLVGNCEHDVR
jgi:hypothetical protein